MLHDVHPATEPVVSVAPSMTEASFSTKPRLLRTAPLPDTNNKIVSTMHLVSTSMCPRRCAYGRMRILTRIEKRRLLQSFYGSEGSGNCSRRKCEIALLPRSGSRGRDAVDENVIRSIECGFKCLFVRKGDGFTGDDACSSLNGDGPVAFGGHG